MKARILAVMACALASLSCFGGDKAPPFSRDVRLDYQGAELIIGYTTISYVNDVFGEPDTSVVSKYGGEDFFWENMLKNTYFGGNLRLTFSIDKEVLIQIIFTPLKEDAYAGFLNIDGQSGRDKILNAVKESGYGFDLVENSTTIWLYYYQRDEPYLYVACGFQFNDDQSLHALNYQVNAPW